MSTYDTCEAHGLFNRMCRTCQFSLTDNDPPHRSMHTLTLLMCEGEMVRYRNSALRNIKRDIPTDHYEECIEWLENRIKTLKTLQLLGIDV